MSEVAGNSEPRAMLERLLPLLVDGNMHAVADLYAEDGVHELPFAPPAVPGRIEGREKIRAYFTAAPSGAQLNFTEFRSVAVHDTADPGRIVAEYDACGNVPRTGRAFTVRFVWVLWVSDGEIVCWRDYWNPVEIFPLQGIPLE